MKKPEKPTYTDEKFDYGKILNELIKANKFDDFFKLEDTEYSARGCKREAPLSVELKSLANIICFL